MQASLQARNTSLRNLVQNFIKLIPRKIQTNTRENKESLYMSGLLLPYFRWLIKTHLRHIVHWPLEYFLCTLIYQKFRTIENLYLVKTWYIKGYFRYKTITSQNVSSETQARNLFYLVEKSCFVSQDIEVFLFLTIQWFTKSVTS